MINGLIEKIDIIIRLAKSVRCKLPKLLSFFFITFLFISKPFFARKSLISKIEILLISFFFFF